MDGWLPTYLPPETQTYTSKESPQIRTEYLVVVAIGFPWMSTSNTQRDTNDLIIIHMQPFCGVSTAASKRWVLFELGDGVS